MRTGMTTAEGIERLLRTAASLNRVDGVLEVSVNRVGDEDGPWMRGRSAGVGDYPLPRRVGVPGFHRRPLVGRRERGEDGVARVDVPQVRLDELGLVPLRPASVVAAHRIDRLPTACPGELRGTSPILLGIRRSGEVDAQTGLQYWRCRRTRARPNSSRSAGPAPTPTPASRPSPTPASR